MQLVYYPDLRLLKVCSQAPLETSEKRAKLAVKMWKIMRKKRGVGLAAPQVGLDIRMFVWRDSGGENHAIWNPTLSYLSGSVESTEGCLSLPQISVTMDRATSCVMSGEDILGSRISFFGEISTVRIWQHEIDHLDGKLIVDNMNREDTLSNKVALRTLLGKTSD